MLRTLVFTLSTLFSVHVLAQTCLTTVTETAPEARFTDNLDGTMTDTKTGLMWMRCSIGQTYDNGACVGEPEQMTWQEALQQAQGFQLAEQLGWRLPNVKELASIVERACERPAVNGNVFPATLSDDYWTSTPSLTDADRAWLIAFFNGSNAIKLKSRDLFVRLVRTAD